MGKMKELFMEERYQGGDFLQEIIPDVDYETSQGTGILCPNCMVEKLEFREEHELECPCCGHKFELVDNTVKFK